MENTTNAKIMGGLVLAGFIVGAYFLFKKGGLDGLKKPILKKISNESGATHYRGSDGKLYMKYNKEKEVYVCTSEGEPMYPVKNYFIPKSKGKK